MYIIKINVQISSYEPKFIFNRSIERVMMCDWKKTAELYDLKECIT